MNAEQASPSGPHRPPLPPESSLSQDSLNAAAGTSKPRPPSSQRLSKSRRHSLPFAFPPLFSQPANSSSTSLVPAEGRPIPLDGGTAAHRISTLRELNSNYPSPVTRHRYAKSTGAQSSTYSQPVIVRTYSGPTPSNAHSYPYRPSSVSRSGSRRIPLPSSSRAGSYLSRGSTKPTISQTRAAPPSSTGSADGRVIANNMPRPKPKKSKLAWQWPLINQRDQEEPKLPPLEAFSFKSFMAELQNEGAISTDIDRIAEICARSRYSMSNQYEVHVAPHGSGASFASSSARNRRRGPGSSMGGPTLQAIASDDDESSARGHRKRRSGIRQKSVAYGTLETIMSSSGSSEDGKEKKKSAAEIAEEVRGRAARKTSGSPASASGATPASGSGTRSGNHSGEAASQRDDLARRKVSRRKSASLANALLENRKHSTGQSDAASPRSSASALVGEPAQPQTSPSHLEIRTAPESALVESGGPSAQPPQNAELMDELADMVSRTDAQNLQNNGPLAGWNTWIPWKGTGPSSHGGQSANRRGSRPSHAEGSLRQLLVTVESKDKDKGKAVIRHG
ncbi:hypothetical protein NKR19_g4820 [Coniochaeta hoffmannii]|uniref:Uncharacterized protein n=1 Tax=Coniochaeta hoffmannii TaxID=91930 RepID=A0AA38S8X6_9PEZI|nr:hypothetical protein NKR19_g4820 [Coniochaeta hoffmannii]